MYNYTIQSKVSFQAYKIFLIREFHQKAFTENINIIQNNTLHVRFRELKVQWPLEVIQPKVCMIHILVQ